MFYVLNFRNHSFKGTSFPEEVVKITKTQIDDGLACEDEIEIVNASDDNDGRMSLAEFTARWT